MFTTHITKSVPHKVHGTHSLWQTAVTCIIYLPWVVCQITLFSLQVWMPAYPDTDTLNIGMHRPGNTAKNTKVFKCHMPIASVSSEILFQPIFYHVSSDLLQLINWPMFYILSYSKLATTGEGALTQAIMHEDWRELT